MELTRKRLEEIDFSKLKLYISYLEPLQHLRHFYKRLTGGITMPVDLGAVIHVSFFIFFWEVSFLRISLRNFYTKFG